MGVKKVDMGCVKAKMDRIKTDQEIGAFATSQALRLMNPYVPMDTGVLAASTGGSQPWHVIYDTPYAKRQYYGVGHRFSHEKHPAAKAMWKEGPDWQELGDLLTEKLRSM